MQNRHSSEGELPDKVVNDESDITSLCFVGSKRIEEDRFVSLSQGRTFELMSVAACHYVRLAADALVRSDRLTAEGLLTGERQGRIAKHGMNVT